MDFIFVSCMFEYKQLISYSKTGLIGVLKVRNLQISLFLKKKGKIFMKI